MKKILILLFGLLLLGAGCEKPLGAVSVFKIQQGGTQTSTAPQAGQMLIGDGTGLYTFVASSTFGSPSLLPLNNTWTGTNSFQSTTFTNATGTNLSVSSLTSLATTTITKGHILFSSSSVAGACAANTYCVGLDSLDSPKLQVNVPASQALNFTRNGTTFLEFTGAGAGNFSGSTSFLFNISDSGGGCAASPSFAVDDGSRTAVFTICSSVLYVGNYSNIGMSLVTNQTPKFNIAAGGDATALFNFTVVGTSTLATTTINNQLTISVGGLNGRATCWKTTTTIGYCSSVVGVGGDCTCN